MVLYGPPVVLTNGLSLYGFEKNAFDQAVGAANVARILFRKT